MVARSSDTLSSLESSSSPYRLPARFSGVAIAMMAVSISLTQIFIGLAILAYIIEQISGYTKKRPLNTGKLSELRQFPPLLTLGAALFFILILSGLWHALKDPNTIEAMQRAVREEWADFPLYLFGVLIWALAREEKNRKILLKAVTVFTVILILSGIAATFSQFRLSRVLTGAGNIPSARNRPQHPSYLITGIQLYQPIGFMNTRLTYAGLLILILPVCVREAYRTLENLILIQSRQTLVRFLGHGSLLLGALLLIVLNKTRSAQIGAITVLFLMLIPLLFSHQEKIRKLLQFGKTRGFKAIMLLIIPTILVTFAIFVNLPATAKIKAYMLNRTGNLSRHTDVYRPVIWSGSGTLLLKNPILGVGPGNFEKATLAWRKQYVRQNPTNWYFVENAPRGHAHNDFLHLGAIAGVPAALIYLILLIYCFRLLGTELDLYRESVGTPQTTEKITRIGDKFRAYSCLAGCIAIYPAGIFQCYYQDDEVIVFYWVLAGMASALLAGENKPKKIGQ